MTPEEVNTLKFRASVEGVAFDVPVNYHYGEYEYFKTWPRPPQAQVEGRERPKADVIKIDALLPDLEPYTTANRAAFDKPGYGKKVHIYMTKRRRNWQYYFDNTGKQLERVSDSPEVPGMLHYRHPLASQDIYFSHDRPDPNLIRVRCSGEDEKEPSPACEILTVYLDRFELQIRFGRPYLSQWRDIERKSKALYDRFRESAHQESSPK